MRAWTPSVMILLEQTQTLNTMTFMGTKVMTKTEKMVIRGPRVLVAIVCTCRVWRKDFAARGFRAGKKSINLQVFG